MGCDIHCFIEYKRYDHWNSTTVDQFQVDRNYYMFGQMAGVRGDDSVKPKGIPGDISWATKHSLCYFVTDGEPDTDNCISKKDTDNWSDWGAKYFDDDYIIDTDSHSHSWLTLDEYRKIEGVKDFLSYKILLLIMEEYEKEGFDTRLVFWFDN